MVFVSFILFKSNLGFALKKILRMLVKLEQSRAAK